MKKMRYDLLSVERYETREQMGRQAASDAAVVIRSLLQQKQIITMMFAAAPSQNEMLAALCEEQDIDWRRVHAFHMDEYIGLQSDHPAGFGNFLRKAIFDRLPFGSVRYLGKGEGSAEQMCEEYSALLRENAIDICMMGVGENGHIAFNDPPLASFHDPRLVKIVTLEQRCRMQQVHDGCFSSIDTVPTQALTVTIPGLLQAKHIFCVVPGKTKAQAVKQMLEGPVDEACPASILKTHKQARLYLDADSAKELLEK